jgi:2-dehydro-3-deoxy-D-gluconate 5-dehydrogenase
VNPTNEQLIRLDGQVAIVTGAAKGIGAAIAARLVGAGAAVTLVDLDTQTLLDTARKLEQPGARIRTEGVDVSSPSEATRVVKATVEAFGGLDILVNNAGIFPMVPVLDVSATVWDRVHGLNLRGLFFWSQAAARQMVMRKTRGAIINITSIDAFHPSGALTAYDASKGGAEMLTRSMALELGRHGIRVNAIAPGAIATPGAQAAMTNVAPGVAPDAVLQGFLSRIPMGRMGDPDDIARVVLFLASPMGSYVTGGTLVVDGGYLLS